MRGGDAPFGRLVVVDVEDERGEFGEEGEGVPEVGVDEDGYYCCFVSFGIRICALREMNSTHVLKLGRR